MDSNMRKAGEQLVEYGKKLVETGLVQGTWGNLSIRISDISMLVTPSGLDYEGLGPEDMVEVDIATLQFKGNHPPTSEKGVHAGIYRMRSDVGAVIHTHSKCCAIFAAARKSVPIEEPELRKFFGSTVSLAAYALPGTNQLWENTLEALSENSGCIMAGHGMLCVGKTLREAFENCCRLEDYCGRYIESRYAESRYNESHCEGGNEEG